MILKNYKLIPLLTMLMFLPSTRAARNIIVERYEKLQHPILNVFKEYGLTLYKVSYVENGMCPIFYVKFKYGAIEIGSDDYNKFDKLYYDLFKANSKSPYILINKQEDFVMNVGWRNKEKQIFTADMEEPSAILNCKTGMTKKKNILNTGKL